MSSDEIVAAVAPDCGAAKCVEQLANVARPGVAKKKILCSCRKFLLLVARLAGRLSVHLLQQMINEQAEVPCALAERRNLQDSHGKAVEQVLSESACRRSPRSACGLWRR